MTPKISLKLCNGCGACVEVCPTAVLAMQKDKAKVINADACIECRACEVSCPTGAISFP